MFKIAQVVLDWVVNIVNVSAIQKLLTHTWPHEVQKVPRGPMHHPSPSDSRSEDLILVKVSERRKLGTSGEPANRGGSLASANQAA